MKEKLLVKKKKQVWTTSSQHNAKLPRLWNARAKIAVEQPRALGANLNRWQVNTNRKQTKKRQAKENNLWMPSLPRETTALWMISQNNKIWTSGRPRKRSSLWGSLEQFWSMIWSTNLQISIFLVLKLIFCFCLMSSHSVKVNVLWFSFWFANSTKLKWSCWNHKLLIN